MKGVDAASGSTPGLCSRMIKQTLRNPALRKRATQFGRLVRHSAVTPRCGETYKPRLATNGELGVTFIGHASFFVQIGGQSVMIDPTSRAGFLC